MSEKSQPDIHKITSNPLLFNSNTKHDIYTFSLFVSCNASFSPDVAIALQQNKVVTSVTATG